MIEDPHAAAYAATEGVRKVVAQSDRANNWMRWRFRVMYYTVCFGMLVLLVAALINRAETLHNRQIGVRNGKLYCTSQFNQQRIAPDLVTVDKVCYKILGRR